MGALLTADGLLALATLSAMEIVLGIDNVVFIAILVGRLPEARREVARRLGLILALGIRVLLLFAITWMMGLTAPLVSVLGHAVSGRDLILLGGGLFLIFKATWEIYDKVEAGHHEQAARATFPQMPADEDGWRKASFLVGSPADVVASLREWEAAGVQRVLLQMLDMEDLAAIELFARHVLPEVK